MSVRHHTASRAIRRRAVWRAAVVGCCVAPLGACEWFTDFKRQPNVTTWEALDSAGVRGNPQNSVPITGTAVPGFAVSHAPMPQTVDSMSALVNPTAPDSTSLANGRKYYVINCAVCHGMAGKGDGTATRYGMPGISIAPTSVPRTDGYLFGIIRNGRGMMPPYNRIEEQDRWDVVNYIRGLQGSLGTTVPTGPFAVPGVTGQAMPGATTLGPTRPVPHTPAGMPTSSRPAGDTAAPRTPADTATNRAATGAPRQGERE
jgi:mono/diheme cytochrome c family protein